MGGESCVADLPSKRTFEIIPGVGVPPVHFGMIHADARRVLGDPDSEDQIAWFYDECALMINFDERGKVCFIEFTWSGARCDVWYGGVSVFDTLADELVRVISGELPATEDFEFTSDELGFALWRPVLPSWHSPEDPDDEYRKGRYWQTVGIWNRHLAVLGAVPASPDR
jgi:hypothetical protein